MRQWQYDPIQGLNIYNMKTVKKTTPAPIPKPLHSATKTLTKTYRQVLTTIKPKKQIVGNGVLNAQDAAELLRRFK